MASRPGAFDHVADDVGWKSHATHEAFPGVHNLVFLVRVGKTGDSVLRCHAAFSVSYAEGVLPASRFSAARNANYRVMTCQWDRSMCSRRSRPRGERGPRPRAGRAASQALGRLGPPSTA